MAKHKSGELRCPATALITRDVNEYSNNRISYEYSNAISGFEYSHNFLTCNIFMYQFKGLKFKAKGQKII